MNKIKLVAIQILLLSGCGAGVSDYSEELGDGYKFINHGSTTKYIRSSVTDQHNIYGTVMQNQHDDNFIIAVQQPNKEGYRIALGFDLRGKDSIRYLENSESDIIESEWIADSLILNDPYYQKIFAHKSNLWIISKKDKRMYGPLTMKEYIKKRKDLRVPEDLQFESEDI